MNEDNKDALNNLINSIQEKMNNTEKNESSQNSSNDIFSLLNSLNSNSNTSSNNNSQSNENAEFDPNILFKIQKIMSSMNSNNPKKNLLLSLKPFLRKSRQDKMSEYITILNVISILESLKNKDSD